MAWTNERVDALKKLWVEGLTALVIAKQLGGTTRSAVLGKVNRLGLPARKEPSIPGTREFKASTKKLTVKIQKPAQPRRIATTSTATSVMESESVIQPMVESPGSATLLTIGDRSCKWPIGDPLSDEFTFCGRRANTGVYCDDHGRVAYQPAKSRDRKRSNAPRSLPNFLQ